MFTFYSVSFILNSKVVLFLSHTCSLLLFCVLTATGGYGDHRGSQKSGPACFGPWPESLPSIQFHSMDPPCPSPFPRREHFQERHPRLPVAASPALTFFPDSMTKVHPSSMESGSTSNYLLVVRVFPDWSPDLAFPIFFLRIST